MCAPFLSFERFALLHICVTLSVPIHKCDYHRLLTNPSGRPSSSLTFELKNQERRRKNKLHNAGSSARTSHNIGVNSYGSTQPLKHQAAGIA